MALSTEGAGGAPPSGVVWIDISDVGKRATLLSIPLSIARASVLFMGTFILLLAWAGAMVILIDRIGGTGPNEAIALIIGLPLAFGPFLYGFYWLMSRRERWDAGIEPLLSASSFSPAELARPVPHLNISLKDLIDSVNGFAATLGTPVIVHETNRAMIAKAWSFRSAAWFGLLGGIFLSANTENWLPAILAFAGFHFLLLRANKALQPSLQALLAQDKRKPVLLLRSFKDDEIKASQRFPTPIGDIVLARRFEQGIAGSLGALGPLIGIGAPGEELPQIGASRAYLDDQEWQPAVLRWLDQALLIVMIAGATEWITWELHRIIEKGRTGHLFILMPPKTDQARWQNILDALAQTSWHAALRTIDINGLLLLQLRPDGKVIAIKRQTPVPFVQDYQLAMAVALYEDFCRKAA